MKRNIKIVGLSVVGIFILLIIVVFSSGIRTETNPEQTSEAKSGQPTATSSQEVSSSLPSSVLALQSGLVKVLSVVDGDTVKVLLDGETQTIRLIGVDTPEVVDPRKPVQCFGKEASAKAKATLTGQMVRLESDPIQGNFDKYQRLLRYVFLADGTSYNELMIAEGYAHEYTYDTPYKYQAEYKAAQAAAEKAQLGLWSPLTCDGDTTQAAASSSTVEPQVQPQPASASQSGGHTFYLSTYYTSKYYYCDTDPGWQSLSKSYLKSYPSEQALLAAYPSRMLHAACE